MGERNVALVMNPHFDVVEDDASAADALAAMTELGVGAMPVRSGGLLVRKDVEALVGGRAIVRDLRRSVAVAPNDSTEHAYEVLEAEQVGRVPVVAGGRILGTISRPEIEELWAIEREAGNLNYAISPKDEMFQGNGLIYLRSGMSALSCIKRSLASAATARPMSILDFACGHGRVLRFLRAAYPKAAITASDLDLDAVSFCETTFGVDTFVSCEDPRRLTVDRQFNLIWTGSLLTHLDAAKWRLFARFFESLLKPGGVVVFTTHGAPASERIREHEDPDLLRAYDQTGFGYADYPESPGYGVSLSTLEWVRTLFASETDLRFIHHAEGGWNDYQDVMTYTKP